jgi:CRP/FNR family transcriptional regulator, cyclic AMP receptor protein
MRVERSVELLGQASLFRDLTPEKLKVLADRTVTRRYRRGQLMFQEGEPAHSLFLIAEGSVKVFLTSPEGDSVILVTLGPGDAFGELALIDGNPRSASAEALQDTVALELGRNEFLTAMAEEPRVAEAVIVTLGSILRRLTEQAADLVFLDLHGRIAKLLLQMSNDVGKQTVDGIALDLHLTQSEIASMVGGSRQSVNQVLRSFERRGYIEVRGKTIVVKEPETLKRRATL